jgi:hypothetical protein
MTQGETKHRQGKIRGEGGSRKGRYEIVKEKAGKEIDEEVEEKEEEALEEEEVKALEEEVKALEEEEKEVKTLEEEEKEESIGRGGGKGSEGVGGGK